MTSIRTTALAFKFAEILVSWLSSEELQQVVERNKSYDDSCCASHDFCDPNMAMLEAYAFVHRIDENDIDLQGEGVMEQMNEAWLIAKRADFAPTAILPNNLSLHF